MATTFEQWAKKVIASGVLSLAVCHPAFAHGFGGFSGGHMSAPSHVASASNASQYHAVSHIQTNNGIGNNNGTKGVATTWGNTGTTSGTTSGNQGSSALHNIWKNGGTFKQQLGGAGSTTGTTGGSTGNGKPIQTIGTSGTVGNVLGNSGKAGGTGSVGGTTGTGGTTGGSGGSTGGSGGSGSTGGTTGTTGSGTCGSGMGCGKGYGCGNNNVSSLFVALNTFGYGGVSGFGGGYVDGSAGGYAPAYTSGSVDAPVAAPAQQTTVLMLGKTYTMPHDALGTVQGQMVLEVGEVVLPVQVNKWNADNATFTLPMIALLKPVNAKLDFASADHQSIQSVAVQVLPADQSVAAK